MLTAPGAVAAFKDGGGGGGSGAGSSSSSTTAADSAAAVFSTGRVSGMLGRLGDWLKAKLADMSAAAMGMLSTGAATTAPELAGVDAADGLVSTTAWCGSKSAAEMEADGVGLGAAEG